MNQIKTILALSVILGFLTCQQTEKKDDTTAIVGLLALQSQQKSATAATPTQRLPVAIRLAFLLDALRQRLFHALRLIFVMRVYQPARLTLAVLVLLFLTQVRHQMHIL